MRRSPGDPAGERGRGGRKIRIATKVEITQVYEIDLDQLVADDYFATVDLNSHEALYDAFSDWFDDAPDDWEAPWAAELEVRCAVDREVYEVALRPQRGSYTWPLVPTPPPADGDVDDLPF